MATTDVIFRIGTLGISKTQAELGVAAAAIIAIGRALKSTYEEADKFSKIFESLGENQKKQVMAMDKATKGYISTVGTMTAVSKLNFAGVKTSSEGMAAMAKIAAVRAKDLGENSEQASQRLERMTDAIVRGTDRGLRQYNVELTSTGTLSEKQAELFSKIVDRAKDLEMEIAGLDEKWAAMNNTLDTSTGLVFTLSSTSIPLLGDGLDWVTNTFSNFNEIMVRTNGSYLNMMFDIEMSSLGWEGLVNDLASATAGFLGLDNAAYLFSLREKDLKNKATARAKEIIGQDAKKAATRSALAQSTQKAEVPKPRGGGGRAKPPDEMVFTEEEAFGTSDVVGDVRRDRIAYEESMLRNQIEMEEELAQQQEKSIEREGDYLANLREEYVQWGLTADRKAELWTLEEMNAESQYERTVRQMELEDQQLFQMERQVTMQDALKNAVRSSAVHMSASTAMMKTGWDMTTKSIQMGVRAAIEGKKGFAKALKDMVADMLASLAELAAVQAIVELAEAIGCFARQDYVAAPQHLAAMAAWIAVGVAAGAASAALSRGGGGGNKASSTVSSGKAASSSSNSGYEGAGYGGGESTVVKIYVEGTLSALFNSLRVESEKQRMTGSYDGGL